MKFTTEYINPKKFTTSYNNPKKFSTIETDDFIGFILTEDDFCFASEDDNFITQE
jgi:hypothetical protein